MTRYKLTKEERATRSKARWKIIQTANRWRLGNKRSSSFMGTRHIRWAAFICRQHKLVEPELLKEAGFNGS